MDDSIAEVLEPDTLDEPAVQRAGRHYTWWQVWWKALTRPTPDTFDQLLADPAMSFRRALWWMSIAFAAQGVGSLRQLDLTSYTSELGPAGLLCAPIVVVLAIALTMLIGLGLFGLLVWIAHRLALMQDGAGESDQSYYALAAFSAPLSLLVIIIVQLIRLAPSAIILPATGILDLLILGYRSIAGTAAMRSVHGLSTGRAFLCILPLILLGVVVEIVSIGPPLLGLA